MVSSAHHDAVRFHLAERTARPAPLLRGRRLVRLHAVTIGKDFGQSVQILAGIDQRQALVLNPADSLSDGEAVTVLAEPARAAKAR